jgi:DNA replication protein DnaC
MTYSERNYGAGNPQCPICHGLGYIRYDVAEDHPDFGTIYDCECRQAQVEAERIAYLRRLGGLQHLAEKTFATFNPQGASLHEKHRQSLENAYQRAQVYAQEMDGWLVFNGPYGCGKTHLAAAIANAQIEKGRRVLFVTAPDLLDHLRSSFGMNDEEESFSARFEEVRSVPLLVLDDLGIESPTAWATEKLYQVLNHRYNTRLPTVITTNHRLDELELRLRSRLSDLAVTELIVITAPDYRQGAGVSGLSNLNGLSLYHHMTFDSFDLRRDLPKEQRDNLRKAVELATGYARQPEGWLVFMGPYGCGKTHLAAAIANEARRQGAEALFVTLPDLLDHLRSTFAPNSYISYDKRFNEVKTAELLALDDLGTESATPWAKEKLYQLINYRYTAGLPTIITTSHELDELDPRLVTRMRDKRLCRLFAILAPAYLGEGSASRG